MSGNTALSVITNFIRDNLVPVALVDLVFALIFAPTYRLNITRIATFADILDAVSGISEELPCESGS